MKRSALIISILLLGWALLFWSDLCRYSSAQAERASGRRRALLIGISKYESPKFPTLEYPLNDVARLSELLASPAYGFEVVQLTDNTPLKPTRKNIVDAMRRYLVDEARPGDSLLFYYSGHGSSIRNSLSDESDERDETIVPADAVRPVTSRSQVIDIRDKEIAEIFNGALNKSVKLTAIFDSCHSGSIARGDEQKKEVEAAEFDIREIPTEAQRSKPEDRGALVLTAAEDYQQAGGGSYDLAGRPAKYSHFTAELLQTLYEVPVARISSQELFRRTAARMLSAGRVQNPTLAGRPERLDETLFGDQPADSSGRIRAVVTELDEGGRKRLLLATGLADGIAENVELRRIDPANGKETVPPIRIRVKKAGLSLSEFEIVAGGTQPDIVHSGDLFEQAAWVTGRNSGLSVWIPPASFDEARLNALAKDLSALRSEVSIVSDFEMTSAIPVVFADAAARGTEWKVRDPSGITRSIGPDLDAASLSRALSVGSKRALVDLPPSIELRAAIESSLRDSGVALAASRESAVYELVGRLDTTRGVIEYCWVLRSLLEEQASARPTEAGQPLTLPQMTDRVSSSPPVRAAAELKTLALRLGKVRNWLQLSSPIMVGSREFPYRLEIRQRGSSQARALLPGAALVSDRDYDLVLTASVSSVKNNDRLLPEFWVYIMNIDSGGNASYINTGVTERYGGRSNFDPLNPPIEIPIIDRAGSPLKVRPPFGTEVFILLVTDRPIDRNALSFAGVRWQQSSAKGEFSPLDDLLKTIGVDITPRGQSTTPDTWALQRLIFKSTGPLR